MRLLLYFLTFFSVFIFSEYKNSDGKAINKSFKELMQWQRSKIEPNLSYIDISEDWKNYDLENHDNFIIWIGHSTFLIKRNGITIITDPIFSDRASPFRNIGPKRLIPPALSLEDIPKIDFVTVSHNHYDHLDIQSLVKISKLHPKAKFLVPAGDLRLLKRKKFKMHLNFNGGSHIKIQGLHSHLRQLSIGQKGAYLIEIKVYGAVGSSSLMITQFIMQVIQATQMIL